jgi:hypothetical protein
MIIQKLRHLQAILRLGPVTEHDGDGGQHLHVNTMMIALLHTCACIPTVRLDFTKKPVTDRHPGAAGFVMIQLYESSISKLRSEIGNVLGEYVSVNIYG